MSAPTRVELDWPTQNAVRIGEEIYFGVVRNAQVHLVRSRCPHRGGPLHLGQLDGDELRCPWHGNTARLDRLCQLRALPIVQNGSHIVAYVPAEPSDRPVPGTATTFPKRGQS